MLAMHDCPPMVVRLRTAQSHAVWATADDDDDATDIEHDARKLGLDIYTATTANVLC